MSLILGTSNEDYHANRSHLSSSALKLLLKSPEEYYKQYVLNLKTEKFSQAFEDGTLLHTLVLEADALLTDYAIFPGLRRYGQAFEDFKAQHAGKRIITNAQLARAEKWYQGFASLPVATKLISGGFAEHTMTGTMLDIPVKARADYINIDAGYIADVKTSIHPTDPDTFRHTISEYSYALSAALYCEIARQTYGKLFEFYWLVVSKTDGNTAVYKASSDTLTHGSGQVTQALVLYKKCMASGVWAPNQPRQDFSTSDYEVIEL